MLAVKYASWNMAFNSVVKVCYMPAPALLFPIASGLCDNNPCQNGGTCNIWEREPGYYCNCPQNYEGYNCEFVTRKLDINNISGRSVLLRGILFWGPSTSVMSLCLLEYVKCIYFTVFLTVSFYIVEGLILLF